LSYYHGTNLIIDTIDLSKSRLRTDFGKGFYFADKSETAQSWALRRMEFSGGIPTVIRYDVSNGVFRLHGKRFDKEPSLEWLHFISDNRRGKDNSSSVKEPRHDYNWVSGPIANDKIADVVDNYLEGDITDKEAVKLARALPYTYQLSLHTKEAVFFVNESNITYKQFKNSKWPKSWRSVK